MKTDRQRYLERRAMRGPWRIAGVKHGDYSGAVVIPACDEESWLFRTLNSLSRNPPELLDRFLVLVVVNHPRDADHRTRIANRRTLEQFTASPLRRRLQLGWIDACSEGYELAEGGVGSARKLGFDQALARLSADGDPILASLDADTLVDADYLAAVIRHFSRSRSAAAVLPFAHQPAATPDEQRAIDSYELYVHCTRIGLTLARSPYAYHTFGSALACTAAAYVRCGGMNRRKGGEDFYFLQALAKAGGVEHLSGTTVHPAARLSTRVPIGTGPSLIRLVENPDEPMFFPLASFELLGKWLSLAGASTGQDGHTLQSAASHLDARLGDYLHHQRFGDTWDRLRHNHRDQAKLLAAFHTWFDGLKTLRLLNALARDPEFARRSAGEAVPDFVARCGGTPTGTLSGDLGILRRQA